jgi:hypothetical protein
MSISAPVLVTMWLDPPLQSDFQVGQAVTCNMTFADRRTKVLVDPDSFSSDLYNPPLPGPSFPTLVKDAVGVYHTDLQWSAPGRWLYIVSARDGGGGLWGTGTLETHVFDLGAPIV